MTFEDSRVWRVIARESVGDWKAERERRIKAEKERDEAKYSAEVAKHQRDNWESIARQALAEQPRPLTARENLAALWDSAHRPVGGRIPAGTAVIVRSDHGDGDVRYRTLEATGRDLPDEGRTLERNYPYGPENGEEYRLLDPPARPEGAEKVEAVLHQYWSGDINGDELANRIAEEMNR